MIDILDFPCQKEKLDNGLEVILYEDNSLPIVSVNIWYRVGSANEEKGKTGFAHLFEHMMFQGSLNVPKEMHFKYIQEAGGTLNGSTSFDRTNYFETLPSNSLELALWLESDRMGFLLPSLTQEKLNNQKDVVINERKQNYDNQPYGLAWEILFAALFPEGHPYSWPTIGYQKDIEKFELDEVKRFFEKFYAPNNASLAIAGQIDKKDSLHLVKKYFDEIPANGYLSSSKSQQQYLSENKKIVHAENVQLEKMYLAWHSDSLYKPDDAAMDILSEVISGSKNSVLQRKLIFEKQLVQNVSAFQFSGAINGTFIITATLMTQSSSEEVKEIILNEISQIKNNITDEDVIRAKNSIRSSFIYSLQKIESIADYLNSYNTYLGNPNSFNHDLSRYESVDKNKIIEVAEKYFKPNFVELRITSKAKNDN